jgi:hypothetical protein
MENCYIKGCLLPFQVQVLENMRRRLEQQKKDEGKKIFR